MPKLRIFHISDLHERAPFEGMPEQRAARLEWDADERSRLLGPRFREALAQFKGAVDIVCFTGDIADWGHPAEYAAARRRVFEILDLVGLSVDRFYAVPGNHDVQRSVCPDEWKSLRFWHANSHDTGALGRWLRQASSAPFGLNADIRDLVLRRTAAFWDWMDSLGRTSLRPRAPKLLGYRATMSPGEIAGLNVPVNIVGLDSAWLCGAEDDQGKIVVTDEQAQAHVLDQGTILPGLRIALIHHPLEHLADGHDIRRTLLDGGVDLLLHGHQHVPAAISTDEDGSRLRTLAAGCLVEGDLGKRWPNGFQIVEIDLLKRQGCVEFRKWSQEGRFWAKGCDIYRDAPEGVLRWQHDHFVRPAASGRSDMQGSGANEGTSTSQMKLHDRCLLDPSLAFALMSGRPQGPLTHNVMLACKGYRDIVFELAMGLSSFVDRSRAFAAHHQGTARFQPLHKKSVERILSNLSPGVETRLKNAMDLTASDPLAVIAMAHSAREPDEQLAFTARLFALAEGLDSDLLISNSRSQVALRFAGFMQGWLAGEDFVSALLIRRTR